MSIEQPNRSGHILGAVVNYGLGSYLPQIVNFFLIPVYTYYIAPTEMGMLEIYLTAQVLVIVVMRLGMNGSITRFYFDYREGPALRDMVTTIAFSVIVFSAVIMVGTLAAGPFVFARFLPEIPFHPYMDIALVAAFFQGAPDIQRRLLEAREQSALYARLAVIFGVLTTLCTVILVVGFEMGILGILWANLVVAILYAATAAVLNWDDLQGRLRLRHLREALAYGLPLVPHHAAAWAHQSIGRLILAGVATAAMVGHLGIAAKVASPLIVISGAYGRAYTPVYFSWRRDLDAETTHAEAKTVGRVVITLGALAAIGAAIFGSTFIRHAMDPAYMDAAPLVGVIAAALFVNLLYMHTTVELFYAKRTGSISIIFILASLVNIGIVVWLAPHLGAMGAALGQLLGNVVSVLIVSVKVRSTFPSPLSFRPLAASVVCIAGACLLVPWLAVECWLVEAGISLSVFVLFSIVLIVASGVYVEYKEYALRLIHRLKGRIRWTPVQEP